MDLEPQGGFNNVTESKHTQPVNEYHWLAPRFWHGMRANVWWRLLARNRFKISPLRAGIALGVSTLSPINDLLAAVQRVRYESKIRETRIEHDPIFILGHWRSGTTWLHELLVSNPDFAFPTTYQCLAPSHFLISPWFARYGGFLLPKKRPMDNMSAGWHLPQEDEFALMNLGVPTPYLRIAFPHSKQRYLEYLDFDGLSEAELQNWKKPFLWFLRALTFSSGGKQLVLKSPPHTGRIATLDQIFPNARYIHLVRDPRQLFPSTMRLWNSLDQVQSLQSGLDDAEMKRYVTDCLQRMYDGFHAGRPHIANDRIIDVRYEDLVAAPKETVRKIYEQLNLGDFSEVSSQLDKMLVGHNDYQPNRHASDPQWEAEIMSYCRDYALQYGYLKHAKA